MAQGYTNKTSIKDINKRQRAASMHLRLFPIETRVYRTDDGVWMVSFPAATKGLIEKNLLNGRGNEIERLIFRGVLVPDIESSKEYAVQRAVGSVDHRTYRLRSEIAAKYQFSYGTLMTLSMIENLIILCDYNIFDDSRGLQVDGQKYLEIIPRDGTIVYDYQGNTILNLTNEMHYIDQSSFEDMFSRGIIVRRGHKWKLSRKYWEFRL